MGLRCGWNHFALWLSRICRSDFLGGKRRNECWMVVSWSSAQGFLNARPSVPTGYKGAGPLPLQRRFDSGYIHTIRGGGAFLRQLKKGRWGTVDRGGDGGGARSDLSQSTPANDRRPGGGSLLLSGRTFQRAKHRPANRWRRLPLRSPPHFLPHRWTIPPPFSWWLHTKR